MIVTGKVGYLRMHGKGKKWYDYNYSKEELRSWKKKIENCGAEEVYVYFNNDIGANAPANAKELMELFG